MKSFVKRIGWFFLPFLLGGLGLFLLPYDPAYAFHSRAPHCRNSDWQYDRLYLSPAPIDIAFIGTSQTLCGVSDFIMERQLDSLTGERVQVANFGFCRPGRTLHYALTQTLLERHQPKILFLEVRTEEDRFSHLDFPHIAESDDLWGAELAVNQRYFDHLFTGAKMRFLYWKEKSLGESWEPDTAEYGRSHGFIPTGKYREMTEPERPTLLPVRKHPESVGYQIRNRFPLAYVQKIADLCQEKGVKLILLYLPRHADHPDQMPLEQAYFETLGPIWKPPQEAYRPLAKWQDPEHMNEPGAAWLTGWLVEKLIDENLAP